MPEDPDRPDRIRVGKPDPKYEKSDDPKSRWLYKYPKPEELQQYQNLIPGAGETFDFDPEAVKTKIDELEEKLAEEKNDRRQNTLLHGKLRDTEKQGKRDHLEERITALKRSLEKDES